MEKKYRFIFASLVITVVLFGVIIILGNLRIGIMPEEYISHFVAIIPGPIYSDMLVLFGLPCILYLGFFHACPAISRLMVSLHKKLNGGAAYGIAKRGDSITARHLAGRLVLVSLLSFSIASLVVQLGGWQIFRFAIPPGTPPPPEMVARLDYLHQAEAIFLGTFAFVPVAFIIFLPLWCIEDSGIISYKTFSGERRSPVVEGVQGLYENIVTGYTGISTVITLGTNIYTGFTTISDAAILTPIILTILPLLVTGLISIPIYWYERNLGEIKTKVIEKMERFNLPLVKIPEIDEIKYFEARDDAP
nr:hypothetical protein [Candidatus Sigynarchaeota archaeon]